MAEENHPKTRWTLEEDAELEKWVAVYNARDWAAISKHIPGRTGKSCRLRWCNQLSPDVVKRPFTPEEDGKILNLYSIHGSKWALIAKKLSGRTDNQVKNHFNSTLQRRLRDLQAANVEHGGVGSVSESEPNPPPSKRTHFSDEFGGYGPVVETEPNPYPGRGSFNQFYYPGPPLLQTEQEAEIQFGLPLSFKGFEVGQSSGSGSGSAPPPPPPPPQISTGTEPVGMLGIDPYLLRMMESPIQTDPLPQSPSPSPPPALVLGMGGGGGGNSDNNGFQRMLLQDEVLMEARAIQEEQHHRDGAVGCGGCSCTAEDITNIIMHRMEARAKR